MANYFMIITNRDDYKCDIKNKFQCVGFPARNELSARKMEIGDKIVFYVTKKSVFTAVVEVTGKYFFSQERIWSDYYDLWSHRVKTKPLTYIENVSDGVYIKDIWDDLEFIKNKHKWGSQVQGSFRYLNEHDFNVIYKYVKSRGKNK